MLFIIDENLLRFDLLLTFCTIFAGAARRAGPESMLILCQFVSEFEIISRPLIGRKLATSSDVIQPS